MDIEKAKVKLKKLKNESKFKTMVHTAAIITRLLDKYGIQPIVVGGLSVEIYTKQEYSTRDIDFVSDGYDQIADVLVALGFEKEGRHFYHENIEVAIEIPDNVLAGSMDKILKLELDNDDYIYMISIEDIILDRLRAAVHWSSEEDAVWAVKLINSHFDSLDSEYMLGSVESKSEENLLKKWLTKKI